MFTGQHQYSDENSTNSQWKATFKLFIWWEIFCVKSVRIRSFSGPYFAAFGQNTVFRTEYRNFPYSVRMMGNTDQKNSEYGHFSRSAN